MVKWVGAARTGMNIANQYFLADEKAGGLVGDIIQQLQQQQQQQQNQIAPSVRTVSCWGNRSIDMSKYTQEV